MSFATLILLIASGFSNVPGIEYTERGEKILVDLLWSSKNFNIPADLLLSQYYQESRLKYWARSPKRADGTYDMGVVQMNVRFIDYHRDSFVSEMGRDLSAEEMYEVNIMLGAYVLWQHRTEFHNDASALMAYAGGASNVRSGKPSAAARRYAQEIILRCASVSGMEDALTSLVCAIFQGPSGELKQSSVRQQLWALAPLRQRGITRDNFLTIFKKQ